MEAGGCSILLVSGSLRGASTNSALLRTAEAEASAGDGAAAGVPTGVSAVLYGGMGNLPHFNPDDDVVPGHPAVVELRAAIRSADALLFCTPEYAGALPGSFKNLLDWTVGDDHVDSIYCKPVAWVNVSASPTGAADAHESLRKVLSYVHATVVEAACAAIPVTRHDVNEDGLIDNASIRSHLVRVLAALVAASRL